MPIHYEIYYDVDNNDFDCEQWSESAPLEVHLVQADIVKYPDSYGEFVEEIIVYYTPNPVYSTIPFKLRFLGTAYALHTPIRTVLEGNDTDGSLASPHTPSGQSAYRQWHFSVPLGPGLTLFEFDDQTGPPSKLKVKIKKQTASFTC